MPIDLDAILRRVALKHGNRALLEEDPSPTWELRGLGRRAHRFRLKPGERHAMLCLMVMGERGQDAFQAAVQRQVGRHRRGRRGQEALRQARDLGLVRMERVSGSSDVEVVLASELLEPLRDAGRRALVEGRERVFPAYRATDAQIQALLEALSGHGLRERGL